MSRSAIALAAALASLVATAPLGAQAQAPAPSSSPTLPTAAPIPTPTPPSPEPPRPPKRAEAPRAVAPAEPTGRGPQCTSDWVERVYREAKPSVVRVERPDGSLGTGFVFRSRREVLTALHVVDLGRSLRVVFPDGAVIGASIAAVDEAHDLALLSLEAEAPAPPLPARTDVAIGMPVLAVGNPYGDLPRFSRELEGLLNFSVSAGIVSAKSDAYIQTDAVLSPGNSGGPMLACDGTVVAIADKLLEGRIGFGVPVAHGIALTRLEDRERRQWAGTWRWADGELAAAWHFDQYRYFGLALGGSLVGFDRIALGFRAGLLFSGTPETETPIIDRSFRRLFAEMTLGYRFLLNPYSGFPVYLTVGGGAAGTLNRGSERSLRLDAGALKAESRSFKGGGLLPMGFATLNLGPIGGGYALLVDVYAPSASAHQVLAGLVF